MGFPDPKELPNEILPIFRDFRSEAGEACKRSGGGSKYTRAGPYCGRTGNARSGTVRLHAEAFRASAAPENNFWQMREST